MQEAGELAKNTAILMNVSEFENVDDATNTLISALQAFKTESADVGTFSMKIIDQFNEVGNNYAISTSDLADSLTRSSAALVAANNSIEQSIAMTAAANTTIQDPESVGNALKTVSMRIRGVKTELEEAGEDTEGMVTNTAKLQEKIMALTNIDGKGGVDILTDSGEFKSTYDILLEISKVWEDMSDVSQAALLELIAGKTRGSVVASLFQNGDVLENAYNSAINASGSAQRELDTYLNSIEGRIDLFNNALQTFWMNLINADTVKWFVDAGTTILQILDKIIQTIGVIPTLLSGFAIFNVIKSIFTGFNVGNLIGDVFSITAGFADFTKVTAAARKGALDLAVSTSLAESSLVKLAIQMGITNTAAVSTMTTTQLLSAGFKALGTSILGATKALLTFLFTTPVGWAILAIAGITTLIGLYKKFGPTHENAIKTLNEETEEWKALKDELDAVGTELDSVKKRIEELQSKDKLSFVEESELERLKAISAELEREKNILATKEENQRQEQIEAALDAVNKDSILGQTRNRGGLEYYNYGKADAFEHQLNRIDKAQEIIDSANAKLGKGNLTERQRKVSQQRITDAEAQIESAKKALNSLSNQLNDDWQSNYGKIYGEIGFIFKENNEELTDVEKTWNNRYRAYQDAMDRKDLINNDISKADVLQRVFGATGTDAAKEFQDGFASAMRVGLNPADIINQAMESDSDYAELFKDLEYKFGITLNDIIGYFTKFGKSIAVESSIVETKTYSSLTESLDSYNDVLKQSKDILTNGTIVTQEYKDALIELVGSKEKVNECFINENSLVVKNADGLDDLLKTSRKNIAAEAKLAKAQAKLKYYDLYKQINKLTDGKKVENTATLNQVKSIYAEMTALQKSIAQYTILEQKLLGAANAYDEFATAQEIDSANDYESKATEMVGHLVDAFHTAKLGTESAQAAIKGLVPESVYEDLDTLDERMEAIYGYFTKDLAQYFTVEFNDDGSLSSAEMKLKNVKEFVEDGIANGVFTGSWEEWDLDPTINSLDELAKRMNVTKEVAFAFLQSMETYDISWLGGDASTLMDKLIPNSDDIKAFGEQMQQEFDQTPIDLTARVRVSAEKMAAAGYKEFEGGQAGDYATLYSQTFEASELGLEGDFAINLTPILPDGTVIDGGSDGLVEWVKKQLKKGKKIEELDVFLGKYDTVEEGSAAGQRLSDLQAEYYDMISNYSLENDMYQTTTNLAELSVKIADGSITKEELQEYEQALIRLDELKNQARDKSVSYIETSENLNEAKNKMVEYSNALAEAKDKGEEWAGATIDGVEYTSDNIDQLEDKTQEYIEEVQDLSHELEIIGDVTEYELQVGLEQANEDIKAFKDSIKDDKVLMDIVTQIETIGIEKLGFKNEDGSWNTEAIIKAYPELKNNEAGLNQILTFLDLLDTQHTINMQLGDDAPTVQQTLQTISDTLNDIVTLLSTAYGIDLDTSSAETKVSGLKASVQALIDLWNSGQFAASGPVPSGGPSPSLSGDVGANGTAHARGTAFKDGSWGAPRTETALVGELGPEMLVRNGRWTTVGDNGAEFTKVKKGDIIFNHRQTRDLLSKGYVTGRGKMHGGNAFAGGTAYAGEVHPWTGGINIKNDWNNLSSSLSNAASSIEDAAEEFEEVFDWIEVRLEEINESISLEEAKLENASNLSEQNKIIDGMIELNETLYSNLLAGANEYNEYATKLLEKVPSEYREAAQNGAIAIEEFTGEASEKTIEAIEKYREWAQKAADAAQEAEATITAIRDLVIQQFENAREAADVRVAVEDSQTEKLQNAVDFDETRGLITSDAYYLAMMENSNKKIEYLTEARNNMQKELDEAVASGKVIKGSNQWYELINEMYGVDSEIAEARIELEEFQNSINDLDWDNFDQLISRLEAVQNDTQNLIDLMSDDDMFVKAEGATYDGGTIKFWGEKDVPWTEEGLTTLGLYAQQMEVAEFQAGRYADAIDDLTKDYENGLYSENEYHEKLEDLKNSQYDSIKAYKDAQKAIKDLNADRIDYIKDGINKEIEAYEELIQKKKENLDQDKRSRDYKRSVTEKQKEIDEIEMQIAALANNRSASARAQRARLEAELANAKADLDDLYYDHSIEVQEKAYDDSLESFQKAKEDEIEEWDKYLEDITKVVTDSLGLVKDNADIIGDTLTEKTQEYNLTVYEAVLEPWKDGAYAISAYQEAFDTAVSSTTDKLNAIRDAWQEVIDKTKEAGEANVNNINQENARYTSANDSTTESQRSSSSSDNRTYTVKSGDTLWDIAASQLGSGARWNEIYDLNRNIISDANLIQPGWILKLPKYANGTSGVKNNQLAILDELGDELVMHADGSGRLAFLSKGSAVVPHDISENLMSLGRLDPQDIIERNRPVISAPHVTNNETIINIEYGDILHIDNYSGNRPEDLSKMVDKAFDKHMKELNQQIRRYTR